MDEGSETVQREIEGATCVDKHLNDGSNLRNVRLTANGCGLGSVGDCKYNCTITNRVQICRL
jgi:hypothetical protein